MNYTNRPAKNTQRATIGDVAKAAGVSKTTISRFLSGDYKSISESTLKRIEQTVADLKYSPNRLARGLKRDRSYSIGMIFADISNPFSTSVLHGVEDVCTQHGYSMMVCNTDNDIGKENNYIAMMRDHRIDGLIIHPTGYNSEMLQELAEDHVPVVLIDRKIPGLGFDTVETDNVRAMEEAMQYFLGQGYERIGFFSQPVVHVSSRYDRCHAFINCLKAANHPSANDIYEFEYRSQEQLEQKLDWFLHQSQGQFRMLFAVNGITQLKLINALQKRGIRIPEDVGVAGFDDSDWSPLIGSGITTIAQPTYEIGQKAMETILRRISGDDAPGEHFALPGSLMIRGSTPAKK